MNYFPDNWVILHLKGARPHYRVLAGWAGSYLSSDSWRLNSGITRVQETDQNWLFEGETGSVYVCGKECYGLRMNNIGAWNMIQSLHRDDVELLEDQDWSKVKW